MMKFAVCTNCQTRKWVYGSYVCQDCIDAMIERFKSGILATTRHVRESPRLD